MAASEFGTPAMLKRDVPSCGGKKGDMVTAYKPMIPKEGYVSIEHPARPLPRILIPETDVEYTEEEPTRTACFTLKNWGGYASYTNDGTLRDAFIELEDPDSISGDAELLTMLASKLFPEYTFQYILKKDQKAAEEAEKPEEDKTVQTLSYDRTNIFDGGDWWDHACEDCVACESTRLSAGGGFIVVHEETTGNEYAFRREAVKGFTDGVLLIDDGTEFDCSESFETIMEMLGEGEF